jgi:hypothetical protein
VVYVGNEGLTRLGGFDEMMITMKDLKSDFFFKLANLPAHRWLRGVESLGSFAEVQLASDGQHKL